jgi:formate dehydrogenase iron-sulfur subunit
MHKTPEGPVIYDGGKCMGCRYCMMACPYGIPRYQWEQPVPFVRKCTLCYERLLQGQKPACVEACPEEATIFGERDDLLAEAKRRLRAEPKRYIPKVYGEKEVGGTSVLYVSNVPLDFLGFDGRPGERPLSTEPLPALTWKVLEKVPAVALGMGALMLGTYWVIERRMKIATGEEVTSDE